MKILGCVLLVCGLLTVIYGGVSYNRQRTVIDIGSFKATATEQKNIPLVAHRWRDRADLRRRLLMVPRNVLPDAWVADASAAERSPAAAPAMEQRTGWLGSPFIRSTRFQ